MTAPHTPPEDSINLVIDLEKLLAEEQQLLDMLTYKRGQIAYIRDLMSRIQKKEERDAHATKNNPATPAGAAPTRGAKPRAERTPRGRRAAAATGDDPPAGAEH